MVRPIEGEIRLFMVDPLVLIRAGLRGVIDGHDQVNVVGEAGTLAEARARIPACRPHVVVLDLTLPDGDGVDLCGALATQEHPVSSLILTAEDDEDRVFAAIQAGANGVLHKNDAPEQLVEGVLRVAAGETLVDGQLLTRLVDRVRAQGPEIDTRLAMLTPTEVGVLECLVGGLRNREIASHLHMSQSTVKNHVSSLLSKLGASGRTEAAVIGVDLLATPLPNARSSRARGRAGG